MVIQVKHEQQIKNTQLKTTSEGKTKSNYKNKKMQDWMDRLPVKSNKATWQLEEGQRVEYILKRGLSD